MRVCVRCVAQCAHVMLMCVDVVGEGDAVMGDVMRGDGVTCDTVGDDTCDVPCDVAYDVLCDADASCDVSVTSLAAT